MNFGYYKDLSIPFDKHVNTMAIKLNEKKKINTSCLPPAVLGNMQCLIKLIF